MNKQEQPMEENLKKREDNQVKIMVQPDIKTYYEASVMTTAWYQHMNRQISGSEEEIWSQIQIYMGILFMIRRESNQWGKDRLLSNF